MKISIIITAENKEKYIERAILSCLNQNFKNYEIIVVYSKLYNQFLLKKKFKKKIRFLKTKKIHSPIHDQIYKINRGVLLSRGKLTCLLDGDDTFKKNKLFNIFKNNENSTIIIDRYELIENDKKKKNQYKKNLFKTAQIYKMIMNPWPKNICTSTISVQRVQLLQFFKKVNYWQYNFLAIDILLVIYFLNKIKNINKYLTVKYNYNKNLDTRFVGFGNWKYWSRRYEQFSFLDSLTKSHNLYYSLDKLVTTIIFFLLKKKST
jgi:glycosyltransferase involved in cell wall biosynthesis